MTHELKHIFADFEKQEQEQRAVLASVVDLEGSSYRRPGVRMLIWENGRMLGAVSGGCVEKEILRQAAEVFASGSPKMMSYDGRYRLGCEGLLYILLEPFNPAKMTIEKFWDAIKTREPFGLISKFGPIDKQEEGMGTALHLESGLYHLNQESKVLKAPNSFEQVFDPCFRLLIIGGEHDAVTLTEISSHLGWEVQVVTHPADDKSPALFPGAHSFHHMIPEEMSGSDVDAQTAIVLMTHSFSRDLGYLLALKKASPAYFGVLGPAKRREQLLDALMEQDPEICTEFLDGIYGPAGLNLGAETPQEIAISIVSEILAVTRDQKVISLRDKEGNIHQD